PADLVVFLQHDAMHQKSRSRAKGNQVRQRIELATERTFHPAHPGDAPVEQIKNAGQQNETKSQPDVVKLAVLDIRLDDFGQRHETAEQISRREEVRQKINFQLAIGWLSRGRVGQFVRHKIQSKAAT